MLRNVSIFSFAMAALLSCSGCGSSTSRTAEQKSKAPTTEVAVEKPVAQEQPVLGVSKPYQVGEPKGGCKMIVIYDRKDGNIHNMASVDSDKNGNVVAVNPIPFSSQKAAELFLQP